MALTGRAEASIPTRMKQFYLLLLGLCLATTLTAQDVERDTSWTFGAGLGLDFAQLLQINPKQGAGQNRLGFGGAFSGFANYEKGKRAWESTLLWQYGMQRLGSGIIAQGADETIPFQKAIDELRLNTKYGVQVKPGGKLFWTATGSFLSQVLPTYQFPDVYPGNFVTDFPDTGTPPLSQLFAPATVQFAVGIDYKPSDNFSVFLSPIASKFILVLDDEIAARGVHGNEVSGEPNAAGFFPEFENVDAQLGAQLLAQYKSTFSGDRGSFTSTLGLYSNYLRNPQNVDVDWANALGFELIKNLKLQMLVNIFYDDDVLVQITDYDFPNGVNGLGRRVSVTEQILLTYSKTF